jgi:hypothetical protein
MAPSRIAAQHDGTSEDGILGGHVPQAIHGSSESSLSQSIVWAFEPAPKISLEIVSLVESSLIHFTGMPELRVKNGLSQITGGLEALVKTGRYTSGSVSESLSEHPPHTHVR